MTTGTRPHTGPLLVALMLPAALLALRLLSHPVLTADDAFFLDAGRHLAQHGRLAMGLWGNALGHETLLASYPPLIPVLSAINIWAMQAAHTVLAAKVTNLMLFVLAGLALWQSLASLRRPWVRAIVTVAVLLDPLSTTFFSTLRPEALLIPLVFVLCVYTERVLDGDRAATWMVVVSGVLLAMTHWQFVPTVGYVAVVLIAGAWRRLVKWRVALTYVVAVAVAYAGWIAYVAADQARLDAVRMQLFDAPGSASSLQMAKMFIGTIVAGNLEQGSAASLFLLLASAVLALEWAGSVGRPNGISRASAPFVLGYLAVGLLPALALGYVGPRAVPLYLVSAWVIIRRAAGPAAVALAMLGPMVAGANLVGDLLLRAGYLHESGWRAWLQVSWLWLVVALVIAVLARRGRMALAGAAALTSVLALGVATVESPQRTNVLNMTDPNVRAVAEALRPVVRPETRVLGDATSHYLALKALGVTEVFDVFPLRYFPAPKASRILADMRPDVVLATDRLLTAAAPGAVSDGGLADLLRDHFVVSGAFDVDGHHTMIYVRRP